MPSREQHLQKASANKAFAGEIVRDNPTRAGWAITALFYSALHLVEAYNAKFNFHCASHSQRIDDLDRNPVHRPIRDIFKDLYSYSRNARYNAVSYGDPEYQKALGWLSTIEAHVSNIL
jgi:hypothetical protein